MKKPQDSVRIDLTETKQSEHAEQPEPKHETKDLEVSELEPRIAPVQPGNFF